MSENPVSTLRVTRSNVLVLTQDETRALLVAMCKPLGIIDVAVVCSTATFARSALAAIVESVSGGTARVGVTFCEWESGGQVVTFLPGNPHERNRGLRRTLTIIVSDDGYDQELVRELLWLAAA